MLPALAITADKGVSAIASLHINVRGMSHFSRHHLSLGQLAAFKTVVLVAVLGRTAQPDTKATKPLTMCE